MSGAADLLERPSPPAAARAVAGALNLRPQPGPQEAFLSSWADIAIFGGAAYSGKTFALLLDPLRFKDIAGFNAVIFRRTLKQATNPGGLWDESCSLYGTFGAEAMVGPMQHRFPYSGATVKFAGMEHVNDRFSWDGAQIPLLGFDQLEHFEWIQFWYMISRNRDPSGRVRPYVRATCNPDPDSWLANFIGWWIDQDTGFPIPERSGKLRWFVRGTDDTPIWGDSAEELLEKYGDLALPPDHPEQLQPLSVTFIPGTIFDNVIGMRRDPAYLSKLKGLGRVERERLLGGNWKIRAAAGLLFRREWCGDPIEMPAASALEAVVRAWDLAATEKREDNNPAWTVGVKMARYRKRDTKLDRTRWVVLDVVRRQATPAKVEKLVLETAATDGQGVRIRGPQDPGQAGKDQAQRFVSMLAGYDARFRIETGDKVTRFNPFSAQAERGNCDIVRGPWNDDYFRSLEAFPEGHVKDDADSTSAGFDELLQYAGPINVSAGAAVSESATDDQRGSPWSLRR